MTHFSCLAALASLTFFLSGCTPLAPNNTDSNTSLTTSVPGESLEAVTGITIDDSTKINPLLDAPDRQIIRCKSKDSLSAQRALNDITFDCQDIAAQATLVEMRDAGWRLMELNVGQESNQDGVITMPLEISVIKLF